MTLRAFHFTNAPKFAAFDLAKVGSVAGHDEPVRGFYFTTDEAYGRQMHESMGITMRRMIVEVTLQNPYRAENYDSMTAFGLDEQGASGATVRARLEAAGFDGVIFQDGIEVVALNPEQIVIVENP